MCHIIISLLNTSIIFVIFFFSVVVYTIEVYTGTDPGSDTEAVVSLQLIGQRGDSGKRVLYHSHSQETPFQAGQMDVYKLEAVTLGEVTQVWVGHNGKGRGAGWFCDKIIVKEGPSHDAEEYYFSCGRWLDEGMDDNVTQRLLDRGEPPKDSCKYCISVFFVINENFTRVKGSTSGVAHHGVDS